MTESYVEADPSPQMSFMAALVMLFYNVSYLAFTQNVDVPLEQAGDVLSNLWSVCCSSELGRKSHEATPLLPPPTPPGFRLDSAQLLQATTANPTSRARPSWSSESRWVVPTAKLRLLPVTLVSGRALTTTVIPI
ncbi:hypothetical protein BD779DRAFT_1675695 [Infundibulicybe gibba]|nr:hypothetical protein BD779DRAFT_1675695 [Infundibulicybe gibba]